MSKKTNKTLIGGFVVGALALVVVAVLIFGGGKFFSEKSKYVLYFEGSVKGLNVGAPVIFKGIRIGSVTEIKGVIDPESLSFQIPVYIETERGTFRVRGEEDKGLTTVLQSKSERLRATRQLIEYGLRAKLDQQSFVTGQLMVSLDFYPDKPPKFLGDGTIPEIPTILSPMAELSKTIGEIDFQALATNLTSTMSAIERTVNSPEITETIQNIGGATKDLHELVQKVNGQIDPLVNNINQTIGDFGKLARDVDQKIEPIASGVDQSLSDIRGLVADLDGVVKKIDNAVEPLPETLERVRRVSRDLDDLIANQKPNLERTLENFRVSSQNIKELTERAKEDPSGVLFGKPPPPRSKRRKQ
jgi:paraquat-inducible protein B